MKIHKHKVKNPSYKARLKKKAKMTTLGINSFMPFGKYKGELLQSVISKDPDYVNWMVYSRMIELDIFASSHLRVEVLRKRKEEQERKRQEEQEEQRYYNTRDFNDFFRYFHTSREHNRRETASQISTEKLHPAYKYDSLPERERYGKILRLTGKVTKEDVKSQYRKLALTFHPDKNVALDEVMQETARIMFLQVQKAYEYFQRSYVL